MITTLGNLLFARGKVAKPGAAQIADMLTFGGDSFLALSNKAMWLGLD